MSREQHEMSDVELDQVFSNAAENLSFDFDPAAWTKMKQKLDAVSIPASNQPNPWRKRGLLALLALLLLTTAYYFTQTSSKSTVQNLPISAKKSTEKKDKISLEKGNITKGKSTSNNKSNTKVLISKPEENLALGKPVVVEKSEEKISISESKTSNLHQKRGKIANKVLLSEQKTVNNNDFISGNNQESTAKSSQNSAKNLRKNVDVFKEKNTNSLVKTNADSDRNITEKSRTYKQDLSNKKTTQSGVVAEQIPQTFEPSKIENLNVTSVQSGFSTENFPQDIVENESRLSLKNLAYITSKKITIKPNFIFPVVAFEEPIIVRSLKPQISNSFKKGLYLRLAASPDISLTRMNEMTKSGSNWAALVEYRFGQRWSVQSGVIRSMKYYNTSPESYQWPANWSMPPSMTDINATCKMLDIPLNVRYDITKAYNNRIFVSAGATSYVMLNEKYVYNYENPSDPRIKWKGWEGKTGSYYLSTLNFSVGYERQVLKKLSLQVEPFLKTPISKIGFGKVNLSTVGVFISAKYPLWN